MDAVKLIVILFVVGILIYRKYQLGIALVTGAAVTGILYAVPLATWLNVPYATVTSVSNLYLVGALYFIMLFENILTKKGIMDRLLKDFSVLLPDVRAVLMVIPAFIGLLPSLGGALFSAPLVRQASQGLNLTQEQQFMINYWFRHPWEYFFPVFPNILLAAAIIGMPLREIVVNFFYFAVLMVIVGFLFLIRPLGKPPEKTGAPIQNKKEYLKDLLFVLSPIVAILVLVIFFRWEVALATLLMIVALFVYYRYRPGEIIKEFVAACDVKIISLVGGVLIFKEMMVQSGAVPAIVTSFDAWGITGVMMIGALSIMISFLTGSSQGAIGATYPLILNFPPEMHLPLAMAGLACAAGGHMLSPTHLCLVATLDFFGVSYGTILPKILLMETIMISSAFVAYYFW